MKNKNSNAYLHNRLYLYSILVSNLDLDQCHVNEQKQNGKEK